ncbi:pentapeptide repeat-containing protein [Streptomyces adonidis]|uniref:pentapeptide repeat-containing protein n=1 Tax=Streptomyces adonidis TaxID=3231367 RepID=UPI0034DB2964
MANDKAPQYELEAIRDEVRGPDRDLAERLRELYKFSGCASLKEFRQAIGAQRTGSPPSVGTLSRYLSGDRRPTEVFLYELFRALDEGKPGQLTEVLKEGTLQMYFECIRKTQPARYKAFEAERKYLQADRLYEQSRELVEELHEELQQIRMERDQLDTQLKQLAEENRRVTKESNQAKSLIAEQRAALDAKIAALNEELLSAKEERDQARQERDDLVDSMKAAARAAASERQALVEQHQEQQHQTETLLREALERQRVAEEQLETVRKALGTNEIEEPLTAPTTDELPERCIEAQTRLLNGPDADEQSAAVDDLRRLMRDHPVVRAQIVDVLCQFVRRPRTTDSQPHRAATKALQAVVEQLRTGFRGPLDLSGADLSGAHLATCTLHNARLRGATLRRASLRGADLTEADLTGADLFEADLRGARLGGTNLQGVTNVTAADLEDAFYAKSTLLPDNLVYARNRLLRLVVVDRPGSVTEERSMGRLLRQARERSNLSLPELSTRTRLDLALLQAMEKGDPSSYRTLENLTSVVQAVGADTRQIARLWEALQDRRSALAIREPRAHVALVAAPVLSEGHRPQLTGSSDAKPHLERARSSEMDALRAGQSRERERRQALRTPDPKAAAREREQQETARSAAAAQARAAAHARDAAADPAPDPYDPYGAYDISGSYDPYRLGVPNPYAQYSYDPYPYEPQPYLVDPSETDPYGLWSLPSTAQPEDGPPAPTADA